MIARIRPVPSHADRASDSQLAIAGRAIGPSQPPYVVAEISANHHGDKKIALELIRLAAEAGADAIKLQHYTPETITVRSSHPDFQVGGGTIWDGRELFELYAEAMTPWEWTADLRDEAARVGLAWFSSAFDGSSVEFLAAFDVPAYKIASFEILDLPLIRHAASKGSPLIISTGMATVGEIDAAVTAARECRAASVALLRCNSGYPAKPEEMDLLSIPLMAELWGVPVGMSDHTIGNTAAITAVALGACIIEKHLIRSRGEGGPDAAFSAEPDELAALIQGVREAHAVRGSVRFGPSVREEANKALRPSLRAVAPIAAGEPFDSSNVRSIRPAGGLPPDEIGALYGRVARHALEVGDPIVHDAVSSAG